MKIKPLLKRLVGLDGRFIVESAGDGVRLSFHPSVDLAAFIAFNLEAGDLPDVDHNSSAYHHTRLSDSRMITEHYNGDDYKIVGVHHAS